MADEQTNESTTDKLQRALRDLDAAEALWKDVRRTDSTALHRSLADLERQMAEHRIQQAEFMRRLLGEDPDGPAPAVPTPAGR